MYDTVMAFLSNYFGILLKRLKRDSV